MRGEIFLLIRRRALQVFVALRLAGPVAPAELAVPVDERKELLRRHLHPRLAPLRRHRLHPVPELTRTIDRIDQLIRRHLRPLLAHRDGEPVRDHHGRIPHRNVFHFREVLPVGYVLRRYLEHAPRDHVNPHGTFQLARKTYRNLVEFEEGRRTRIGEPEETQRLAVAQKPHGRERALARVARVGPLRHLVVVRLHHDLVGMCLVIEKPEDVLHREVRRTAVDELLQRVGTYQSETLEHEGILEVDHREHVARDVPRRVADGAPQKPLRLRILAPLDALERVAKLQLRRTPHLALHDVERATVRLHELAQRRHALFVGAVGIRMVRMVDEVRAEVERVLLLQLLEDAHVVLRERDRRAEELRIRLYGTDRLGRAVEHLRVFGPLPERFVPDFPFVHHVLVAFHARDAILEPRLERLRLGRDLFHLHAETEVAAIDGVSVRKADPGLHPHRRHLADVRIEPRKIILALLLLGLRPAGEEASVLHAERRNEVLVGVPVRVVAVHRLETDRPLRGLHLFRVAHGEASDLLEAG